MLAHQFWGWALSVALLVGAFAMQSVARAESAWMPGPEAVDSGAAFIQGVIDSPASGASAPTDAPLQISGWIVDQTAEGWSGIDDVQVYLGSMGGGGSMLAKGRVGESRPDVAAATGNPYWASAGFDATVPPGAIPPGGATLSVYAHTPAKGWWFQQVQINNAGPSGLVATVIVPGPGETITSTGDYRIRGTAYDTRTTETTGVGVDRVQVYIDGQRGVAGSVFLGEAYPDAQTLWTVTFNPPHFDKEPHHWLHIYVRSAVTGEEIEVLREFYIGK